MRAAGVSIRRNNGGTPAAITIDGYDVLHLEPGSTRNNATIYAVLAALRRAPGIGAVIAAAKEDGER